MPNSITRASDPPEPPVINACAAAADELAAVRRFVTALERENAALKERLENASRIEGLLTELSETRRKQTDALEAAVIAKNETLAAKEALITKQETLIGELKRRKSSPWKRLGDILIGVAISAVLK